MVSRTPGMFTPLRLFIFPPSTTVQRTSVPSTSSTRKESSPSSTSRESPGLTSSGRPE